MKKKWGEFQTLKEACKIAREKAVYGVIEIYKNYDNSYSLNPDQHKKAVFICAVDKSGRRYKKEWKRAWNGKKYIGYTPIKSVKERNT